MTGVRTGLSDQLSSLIGLLLSHAVPCLRLQSCDTGVNYSLVSFSNSENFWDTHHRVAPLESLTHLAGR